MEARTIPPGAVSVTTPPGTPPSAAEAAGNASVSGHRATLPQAAPRAARWRVALSAALFAFVLSRALIFFAAASAVAIEQQWSGPGRGQSADIHLFTPESTAVLRARILANDATWYRSIAERGYERRAFDTRQQANWAFFPLHPYLWRVLDWSGAPPVWSGFALANLLFFIALVQLHRWLQLIRDEETANRGVLCIALFPSAYFFSLPWTESLFLLLASSSLLAMQQRRWGRASAFNAFASATRPTGLLLTALMWWQARDGRLVPPLRIWALAILGGSGLFAFMALLWHRTGDPLAFSHIQAAWGRNGGSLFEPFRHWLTDPLWLAQAWNVRLVNNSALLLGVAASIWLWRQKLHGLAGFALLYLLLPWSTGTLVSMARYAVSCPPLFLAFAVWGARPRWWAAWLSISTCLLVGMAACFALGANFAGA